MHCPGKPRARAANQIGTCVSDSSLQLSGKVSFAEQNRGEVNVPHTGGYTDEPVSIMLWLEDGLLLSWYAQLESGDFSIPRYGLPIPYYNVTIKDAEFLRLKGSIGHVHCVCKGTDQAAPQNNSEQHALDDASTAWHPPHEVHRCKQK